MILYSPPDVSGSVVVPEDARVFDGTCRVKINDQDGYQASPNGSPGVVHPRHKMVNNAGKLICYGVEADFTEIAEGGVSGADEIVRFQKVDDPVNPGRSAFIHRIVEGDPIYPPTTGAPRVEIRPNELLTRGKRWWIAFAVFIPDDSMKNVDVIDDTLIFQVHCRPYVAEGDDPNPSPPLSMLVRGGGIGTPHLATQYFYIRDNPAQITLKEETPLRTAWTETNYPTGVWQYWAIDMVQSYDETGAPYVKGYRRVGEDGPVVLMFHDEGPNDYNNPEPCYCKTGPYYFRDLWSGGLTERVTYSKGIYPMRHFDGLDAYVLMDMLTAI